METETSEGKRSICFPTCKAFHIQRPGQAGTGICIDECIIYVIVLKDLKLRLVIIDFSKM